MVYYEQNRGVYKMTNNLPMKIFNYGNKDLILCTNIECFIKQLDYFEKTSNDILYTLVSRKSNINKNKKIKYKRLPKVLILKYLTELTKNKFLIKHLLNNFETFKRFFTKKKEVLFKDTKIKIIATFLIIKPSFLSYYIQNKNNITKYFFDEKQTEATSYYFSNFKNDFGIYADIKNNMYTYQANLILESIPDGVYKVSLFNEKTKKNISSSIEKKHEYFYFRNKQIDIFFGFKYFRFKIYGQIKRYCVYNKILEELSMFFKNTNILNNDDFNKYLNKEATRLSRIDFDSELKKLQDSNNKRNNNIINGQNE